MLVYKAHTPIYRLRERKKVSDESTKKKNNQKEQIITPMEK